MKNTDNDTLSNPGQHINRISRLSARWLEPKLEKLGLAVAQIPVFGAIKKLGPLPQKELASVLHVEQPSMAQLLSRMERDGLIERKADPEDGRSGLIHLTPRALKAAEPARSLLQQGRRMALQGFDENEVEMLNALLLRVRRNLEAALDEEAAGKDF